MKQRKRSIKRWFQNAPFPELGVGEFNGLRWAQQWMVQQSIVHGTPPPMNFYKSGTYEESIETLLAQLVALGGWSTHRMVHSDSLKPYNIQVAFDHGWASIQHTRWNKHLEVSVVSTSHAFLEKAREIVNVVQAEPKGSVSVIVQRSSGLGIDQIGLGAVNFEERNYDAEVVGLFKHVVGDLNAKTPCGRLAILDGAPGTGKTYLVRSMLGMCPKVNFVILNADMVASLSGPSLIKVLTDAQNHDFPLVLIIEDADSCLSQRAADNVGSISTLLNLGDGILGAMLNLRIVATTNAGHIKGSANMDPAIMRSGRLCRRIHVGKLTAEHANKRLRELHAEATHEFGLPTNLADVYRKASDPSFVFPEEKAERPVGFSPVMVRPDLR
jgi:hypothetical protein